MGAAPQMSADILGAKMTISKGVGRGRKAGPLVHGSRQAYKKGCRCDACRKAHNSYHRSYRAEKRTSMANLTTAELEESITVNPSLWATGTPGSQ